MKQPIAVKLLGPIGGHDSFENAIEFSKGANQSPEMKSLNEKLEGKVLSGLEFALLSHALFLFEDSSSFRVSSSRTGLKWKFNDEGPSKLPSELGFVQPEKLSIDFGKQMGIVDWEIGELARSIVACKLKKVRKSEFGLFIDLEERVPLLLTPFRVPMSEEANDTLLFVDDAR